MSSWAGHTGPELAQAWGVPLVEASRTIGSTSDRAAELGRTDAPRPAIVLAEEQTAGRGRRGDRWQSAAGAGIWMSFLLDTRVAIPQLPLVVGVACARSIERCLPPAGGRHVGIKWPNDLLLEERKVGGILCESGPFGVVIGLGLNVRAPDGGFDPAFAESATALESSGANVLSRMALATSLVADVLELVTSPSAFAEVREDIRARDALAGRAITTDALGPGVGRGIDDDGGLLFQAPDGTVSVIHSGSVRLTERSSTD